jgi:sugar lactone lactonase YvrE
MRASDRISMFFAIMALGASTGFAQAGIITTYAGSQRPLSIPAINPDAIACDGSGGVYVASHSQDRVYRIYADGRLQIIAGNGTAGNNGDGGLATAAQLFNPSGVAFDIAGNLFIAEINRIRKVAPDGVISTAAGNGTFGFSGDGGPATAAQLFSPQGLTVDAAGNLFIVDTVNHRIRKVTTDGVIRTVAGNGILGFSGDGGPATGAQLDNPAGVAVDAAGNLFIADRYNHRIRKVTPDGVIHTIAGNGREDFRGDGGPATAAQFEYPNSVAVDSTGALFIGDHSYVHKVAPNGIITTLAENGLYGFSGDGGPAVSALLFNPSDVAADVAGNLFIADSGNHRIRKITPDGMINTIAGNGIYGFSGDGLQAVNAQLNYPSGVAVDAAGNLFIADTYNQRIRKVTPDGIIRTVAGNGTAGYSGDGGQATAAQLNWPYDVTIDKAGNLFIADTYNSCIRKVTPAGVISTVVAESAAAGISFPYSVTVDVAGNLFIYDIANFRLAKVAPDGAIYTVADWYILIQGHVPYKHPAYSPTGMAVDSSGNLFFANYADIKQVLPSGIISTAAGNGTRGFSGDGGPAKAAQLFKPYGMAIDTVGNLFIADTGNHRIRKITSDVCLSPALLDLEPGSASGCRTYNTSAAARAGYATLAVESGVAPYGTAVFSFKQNGVTVTEAGVPASPPTTSARIFIDYRVAANAVPARMDAGTVDVNTGIAIVNSGAGTATITYTLRDSTGRSLAVGHGTLKPGAHISKFINQFSEVAPDFNLPENFQTAIQFASLQIDADQHLSLIALRMTTNQRNEALYTTTPVADLNVSPNNNPIYFPQFADGGGYTTSLILLNSSDHIETGTFEIFNSEGVPLTVTQAGGSAGSSFQYSIPAGGAARFQTDGFPAQGQSGWVRLTPDAGTSTPVGSGLFGYNPGSILVSESGFPAAAPTTHARIYLDLSEKHNTGLAIANVASADAVITIKAFQKDGITQAGTTSTSLQLAGHGYTGQFANQLIQGLPAGFIGVLDIRSSTPFAALTLRSLDNERHDFLMTTFPVADVNQVASSPVIFPHIADGGGYTTEFILLSGEAAASTSLQLNDETGASMILWK